MVASQKMPKLSDMSPPQSGDETMPGSGYPTIHLEHEHMQKLGLKGVSVGDKVMVHALAHVVSHSQHESEGGEPRAHMQLEVHKMGAEPQVPVEQNQGDDNATAGAKSAMDAALTQQAKSAKKPAKRPISEP